MIFFNPPIKGQYLKSEYEIPLDVFSKIIDISNI